MEYLTETELRKLFSVPYTLSKDPNVLEQTRSIAKRNHLIMCVGFRHALRISEVLSLDKSNVYDGKLIVQRKKKSDKTTQMLVLSPDDPLFDETPILVLAETCNGKFFPITRQAVDLAVKGYAKIAGIHKDKAHFHALGKHSMAMQLWELTHSLGHIKSYLGHKAMSSTMCYLNEADSMIAQKAVAGLFTKGA